MSSEKLSRSSSSAYLSSPLGSPLKLRSHFSDVSSPIKEEQLDFEDAEIQIGPDYQVSSLPECQDPDTITNQAASASNEYAGTLVEIDETDLKPNMFFSKQTKINDRNRWALSLNKQPPVTRVTRPKRERRQRLSSKLSRTDNKILEAITDQRLAGSTSMFLVRSINIIYYIYIHELLMIYSTQALSRYHIIFIILNCVFKTLMFVLNIIMIKSSSIK